MADREYVVLLHGLIRSPISMSVPMRRLRSAGFEVINLKYPSRRKPIPELARIVSRELEQRIPDSQTPVHFLTHSLGGIVLRAILSGDPPKINLGNVVMLAPPNQGSRLAERLGDNFLFRTTTGPAGQQLRKGPDSVPARLGPADYCVGVIAGNRAASPWFFLVPGESDGTVRVDEVALEGMADFLVVPRGHTFIMNDAAVIDQAIHFFRNGKFERDSRDS